MYDKIHHKLKKKKVTKKKNKKTNIQLEQTAADT